MHTERSHELRWIHPPTPCGKRKRVHTQIKTVYCRILPTLDPLRLRYIFHVVQTQTTSAYCRILSTLGISFSSSSDINHGNMLQNTKFKLDLHVWKCISFSCWHVKLQIMEILKIMDYLGKSTTEQPMRLQAFWINALMFSWLGSSWLLDTLDGSTYIHVEN